MIDVTTVGWGDLGWIVFAFALSMWLLSSALTGFERNRMNTNERLLRGVAGLAILVPDMAIALPAMILSILLIVAHRFLKGEPSPIDLKPS